MTSGLRARRAASRGRADRAALRGAATCRERSRSRAVSSAPRGSRRRRSGPSRVGRGSSSPPRPRRSPPERGRPRLRRSRTLRRRAPRGPSRPGRARPACRTRRARAARCACARRSPLGRDPRREPACGEGCEPCREGAPRHVGSDVDGGAQAGRATHEGGLGAEEVPAQGGAAQDRGELAQDLSERRGHARSARAAGAARPGARGRPPALSPRAGPVATVARARRAHPPRPASPSGPLRADGAPNGRARAPRSRPSHAEGIRAPCGRRSGRPVRSPLRASRGFGVPSRPRSRACPNDLRCGSMNAASSASRVLRPRSAPSTRGSAARRARRSPGRLRVGGTTGFDRPG